MSLPDYVRILGRGPGRSRSLTRDEAEAAMSLMLGPDASAEATGAILMLLRMKGETAGEIAGFARAAQETIGQLPCVDLDWPCYAAGRTRGAPHFLTSAKLVSQLGPRVLLHGFNGSDEKVRGGLFAAGITRAQSVAHAGDLLESEGIAYLPLEIMAPQMFRLLKLRDVLGLRSCVNTVCRMLNPANASASVQGVFHPTYRLLQADAARKLGWNNLTVIKGGGGEFERNPAKPAVAFGLRDGQDWEKTYPAASSAALRLAAADNNVGRIQVIQHTTEIALDTLGASNSAARARALTHEYVIRDVA